MSVNYSLVDQLIMNVDNAIKTISGKPQLTERPNPAKQQAETKLTKQEQDLSARFMRINHAGEVSAQGLYQGQALTAKLAEVRTQMERAAFEENDHLAWCQERCHELGSKTSLLAPVWYAGSFTIGAIAGLSGDKWSLGFVAETEKQVVEHLHSHLLKLAANDNKSRAILEQMKEDELHHATVAEQAGGTDLPAPIKLTMKLTGRIMTKTAYYI